MIRKRPIRKKFPPRWKKLKWQSGTYTKKTYRKPSGQLFPNRRPLTQLPEPTKKHENIHNLQTAQKFNVKI